MEIKIGRKAFNIDPKKDLIMDNGVCKQLITQKVWDQKSWSYLTPRVPEKLFNELMKSGKIYTNEELEEKAKKRSIISEMNITYYAFTE